MISGSIVVFFLSDHYLLVPFDDFTINPLTKFPSPNIFAFMFWRMYFLAKVCFLCLGYFLFAVAIHR